MPESVTATATAAATAPAPATATATHRYPIIPIRSSSLMMGIFNFCAFSSLAGPMFSPATR